MRTDPGLADSLIERALKGGAEQAEVYQRVTRTLVADARKSTMESVETSLTFGYCLRVIKGGRAGFSYSNSASAIDDVVADSLASALYTEPDEYLRILNPKDEASPAEVDTYDPSVVELGAESAIKMACRIESACLSTDPRITKIRKSSASFVSSETLIANSLGLISSYRSTGASASISAVAEEGGESQMGWEQMSGRFLREIDLEAVGLVAAKRALEMLGARRITARKAEVMLDNPVAAEFLSIFSAMLSSDAVQKGKSLLKGKIGQRVTSEIINIVDDGLMNNAPGRRPFDDEGAPARRNLLVRDGVLDGYMYNTHTGAKEGRKTTGNAVRAGYMSPPSVGAMSLFLSSGGNTLSPARMMARMGSGLYITDAMGMHTADTISGDFSIGVSGLWIEEGRPVHPVKEAVISGNILEFFGTATVIGDDLKFYGRIGSPCILFGPTDISA